MNQIVHHAVSRRKTKTGKVKGSSKAMYEEPLVETNPEWVKLVSQFQTRSKSKKNKEDGYSLGDIISGGITKKIFVSCVCMVAAAWI